MSNQLNGNGRRQTSRRLVTPSEMIQVQFNLAGKPITGLVSSINKNGLRTTIEENFDLPEDSNLQIDPLIKISGPDFENIFQISDVYLKQIYKSDEGKINLVITAETEEAKAMLWQVMYKIDHADDRAIVHERIESDEHLRIPGRGHYTEHSRLERVAFIREHTNRPLEVLDQLKLIPERLSSNIENLIGSVEIPVGLAGPLMFKGQKAKGIIYAPFATTEGALVASATRGATAITRSGGVTTRVLQQKMMRVPYFGFRDLNSASAFSSWIADHMEEIRNEIRKVSRFANLVTLEPMVSGSSVHVRFIYETGDAAGQNMTTTCTWHACMWILESLKLYPNIKVENFIIEANGSGDKKVNYLSFIGGRGSRVIAECFIYEEDLQKVLKVSSKQLANSFQFFLQGSLRAALIGFNINIANVIAAMFTALGQDIASVHESSIGVFNIEAVEGGIYASMLLPSLIVGSIGGGTALPDQNQYLQIIDCQGIDKSSKLAEIIAGFCLALDLSTLSAIASGQFATAHEKLGRNRPVKNLELEELTLPFFKKILLPEYQRLEKIEALPRNEDGSSIVTELTSRRLLKLMGHFPYKLEFSDGTSLASMVKIKPMDCEVMLMLNSLASMCHAKLAKEFRNHHHQLGFDNCHKREIAIFKQTDPRFTEHAPKLYGSLEDSKRDIYLLVMENIKQLSYLNTVDSDIVWQEEAIQAVVEGLAALHSIWWKREDELKQMDWIGTIMDHKLMCDLSPLWTSLGIHAVNEFPEWFTQEILQEQTNLIEKLPSWWKRLDEQPKTLVHNDFNPRNIALRKTDAGFQLCAYDWELATIKAPQHDLAEFIIFVAQPEISLNEITKWVDMHRELLMQQTGDSIDAKEWRAGFALSLRDLLINRISLYIMAHTMHHYKFIQRITENCRHLIRITEPWLV